MPEISEKQLAANRANAKKSTGPRTAAGKASSSRNALKSAIYANAIIIEGEDRDDLDALRDGYYRDFAPATTDERILLDKVIEMAWRVKRLDATYNQMWMLEMDSNRSSPDQKDATRNVRPFNGNDNQFAKLRREYTTYDRAFHRARTELIKSQKTRAQSANHSTQPTLPQPPNGFVPAIPHTLPLLPSQPPDCASASTSLPPLRHSPGIHAARSISHPLRVSSASRRLCGGRPAPPRRCAKSPTKPRLRLRISLKLHRKLLVPRMHIVTP
jgi:hypothetical protein